MIHIGVEVLPVLVADTPTPATDVVEKNDSVADLSPVVPVTGNIHAMSFTRRSFSSLHPNHLNLSFLCLVFSVKV